MAYFYRVVQKSNLQTFVHIFAINTDRFSFFSLAHSVEKL